ncbi:MAG TPA: HAD hydrolase-like protein [Thermoanaerobaculia bacterium]|jgi:phosphoglycolate phosphatase-like HAD superfamily hydrolase|nr:HAD hydrolase-like protein [Thermoanaerobaculia bacterium]
MKPDRLVLFDIDGTLLSSGTVARDVFARALEEVFGTAGDVAGYRFEGKLDPIIVTELMVEAGIAEDLIEARRRAALDRYLDLLEEALKATRPALKPGVDALIESVATDARAVNALLTGNVARGAKLKLEAAALWHRFRFGVFGDEAPTRVHLGPMAIARAREVTGHLYEGHECVVVGDAPADVACGKALGARVVAVATGRTSFETLTSLGADVVLRDFADLASAREAIFG